MKKKKRTTRLNYSPPVTVTLKSTVSMKEKKIFAIFALSCKLNSLKGNQYLLPLFLSNNDAVLLRNSGLFRKTTENRTERDLKLESVIYVNKAP